MRASVPAVLCLLLLVPWPARASVDSLDLAENDASASIEEELYFRPEEIVTGPSKRPVPLEESPANVTIITHDDILQSGATNLGEVFRRVAGMDVIMRTAADVKASARGFINQVVESDRMATLIDGRTFYLEFLGETLWGQLPVPLSDVKRIEVIKGPMSSLYGNRAMLGIINVVTFDPEETETTLGGGGGMNWLGTGEFTNAGQFAEGYWYKVSGVYTRQNEFSDVNRDGSTKDRDDFSVQGRFTFEPIDPLHFALTGGVTQSTERLFFGGLGEWSDRRTWIDGRGRYEMGRWGQIDYAAYWERHYISSVAFNTSTGALDTVDAEIRHTVSFDVARDVENTLTCGFEYRMLDGDQAQITQINNYAGFLQDEFRFYDKVILTGGMRADYQRNFSGLNISAHGSVLFLAHPRYSLRLGTATAFNTPTMFQYFAGFTVQTPTAVPITVNFTPNPGLKAERILYFELDNTITPVDGLRINADAFYYRLNNILSPTLAIDSPTAVTISNQNDGGVSAVGGEIGLAAEMLPWLESYASWSYEQFKTINGNQNPTPNYGNPKNKVSAGLRGYWFGGRLTANLDFFWRQSYMQQTGVINTPITPMVEVGDSYLLNARLAYWPIKDRLELAVAANNILNDNSPQAPAVDPLTTLALAEDPHFNLWGSLRYVF